MNPKAAPFKPLPPPQQPYCHQPYGNTPVPSDLRNEVQQLRSYPRNYDHFATCSSGTMDSTGLFIPHQQQAACQPQAWPGQSYDDPQYYPSQTYTPGEYLWTNPYPGGFENYRGFSPQDSNYYSQFNGLQSEQSSTQCESNNTYSEYVQYEQYELSQYFEQSQLPAIQSPSLSQPLRNKVYRPQPTPGKILPIFDPNTEMLVEIPAEMMATVHPTDIPGVVPPAQHFLAEVDEDDDGIEPEPIEKMDSEFLTTIIEDIFSSVNCQSPFPPEDDRCYLFSLSLEDGVTRPYDGSLYEVWVKLYNDIREFMREAGIEDDCPLVVMGEDPNFELHTDP